MRKLLVALMLLALMAMPAMASVQNVKVSGDIDTTWVVRHQFDLGEPGVDYNQNFIMTQTRLRVDADLTDNVSVTVGLINERPWDAAAVNGAADNTDIDIHLAYATMREMLYSPLTVVVGRQYFAFGNSFIMDSQGNNNNAGTALAAVASDLSKDKNLDAVRMILDYNPLTLDIIYAKVDANTLLGGKTGADVSTDDDKDLYGINANYQLGDDKDTVLEAYLWAQIDKSQKVGAGNGRKADTIYLPGFRGSINLLDGLNLQGEFAWQMGNKVITPATNNIKRSAFATQLMSTYSLPFEKTKEYEPVLHGSYSYLSGDHDPDEADTAGGDARKYTAWDPFYEDQGDGTIINTLVTMSNLHVVNLGASVVPLEDVTLSVDWYGVWLAKNIRGDATPDDGTDTQAILQPDGTTHTLNVDSDYGLANEIGLGVNYAYTEDVLLSASYNFLIPGTALTKANDKTATQFLLSSKISF